jgi:hypothetical protein
MDPFRPSVFPCSSGPKVPKEAPMTEPTALPTILLVDDEAFIQKPYTMADLKSRIARVIEPPPAP